MEEFKRELKERVIKYGAIALLEDEVFDKYVDYTDSDSVARAIEISREVIEELKSENKLKFK